MNSTHRPPLAAILLVPILAAVVLALFAWPSARMQPRGLPIGASGAAAEQGLAGKGDAFDIHRYEDEAAARAAISQREVYGAFVAAPSGMKVLVATSASPVVAQMLTHAAGEGAEVQDVVPAGAHASALPSAILPLVLAGLLTGALCSAIASGALRRTWLALAGSLLAGLAATAIIQSWLGIVSGDWWANAAALTLTVAAIALATTGLEALLGKAGLLVAAVTMILVGNPFSAVASGPELLPRPAGELGQLLPPGAGGSLLRSTGLFDGAAAGSHLAVLAAWALAGLGALALAALRERRPGPVTVTA